MKKRISALVLAILVVLLLPLGSAIAGLVHTPHEDPSTSETNVDIALPILLHYVDILSALTGGRYQDVKTMVEQMDLDQANIPGDVKFVMQRYNDLLTRLSDKLDRLDALLNEIQLLLDQYRLEDAHLRLAEARGLVDEARSLLTDLDQAADQLETVLRRYVDISALTALDEARSRLNEAMQRLKELQALYEALLRRLEIAVEQVYSPDLTLEVDKRQVHVRDTITASGKLTFFAAGETQPLPEKEITILLDSMAVATVITSEDGSYSSTVTIPSLRVSTMALQASYTPEGPGDVRYLPALSPTVEIEIQFYPTDLTLNVSPSTVWVGEHTAVTGVLSSPDEGGRGLSGREVDILIDGVVVDTVATESDGSYGKDVVVSYEQVSSRRVQARYEYENDEYLESSSPIAEIGVQFYRSWLSLAVDEVKPWVGDTITVTGVLTSPDEGGKGISDRSVSILLDGVVVGNVTTAGDGSYQGTVVIPYEYKALRRIEAMYPPLGGIYALSWSPAVWIQVQFHMPQLTLVLDNSKPWVGSTVTASGTLTSPDEGGNGLNDRQVTMLLYGEVIGIVATGPDGSYQVEVVIPYGRKTSSIIQAVYLSVQDRYASCISPEVVIEAQLYPVQLTLHPSSLEAWVGESLVVSGILSSPEEGGKGVVGRSIDILLDGVVVDRVTTGVDGLYQGTVAIPHEYDITSRTIQARYASQGEDEAKYLPAVSDLVDISISFYQTQLQIQTPDTAYPGLALKVSGQITYDEGAPLVDREVSILWDDELLRRLSCQDAFEVEVIPYPQTVEVRPLQMEGEHTLRVVVGSEDRYQGTFGDRSLTVVKSLPEIKIQSMSLVTPPKKIRLKGRLLSDLPLQESLVEVELRGIPQRVTTSADGEFEVVFDLPLDSIVMGSQEVIVRVQPFEVWHLSLETTTKVFVVDGVNLGLISAAFISVGVVLYTRRRGRISGGEIHILETPSTPLDKAAGVLSDLKVFEDNRGRILRAYAEAVALVEGATKVSMRPHMTLREFLREVLPGLDGAAGPFAELTRLSEGALYSPYAPGDDKALRAGELALSIREVLGK